MGKKLTATQIKKELKNRSKDELIELIYDLCKTSKEAVDKINIRLGNDDFLDEELDIPDQHLINFAIMQKTIQDVIKLKKLMKNTQLTHTDIIQKTNTSKFLWNIDF